ncbi:kinase-like protein [Lojkania enalia]|uniref:non-specific serine/threonine protein kinase n=1 Tax=Lojkania enalia TaxID=147567 RepID=A0A9P4N3U0_9PLEO|nr:kinase-like protein [Didymosphaeria enalia]
MLRNNPGSSSGSRFEFIKRLNVDNGGMNAGIAVVRDRKNGKLCIEKRLDPDCIRTRLADMEIEALQQLDHPNVNRIIDVFVDYNLLQGSIFLEMCDGGSLDKLIGRHSVDGRSIGESQIWRWFIQLAKAVAYCHCGPSLNDREARSLWNAVYHRDIKPANVFLSRIENGTQDGEVILKLGDFGCAISACLIENGVVDPRFASRYTPEFAPPEAPLLNKKSDVYQVGGVMACLCRLKQTWQHFDKDQAAGEEYSSKLNMAIRYCMKSNYQERIGAAALVKRLEKERREDVIESMAENVVESVIESEIEDGVKSNEVEWVTVTMMEDAIEHSVADVVEISC